jgi:hypothetical protein
MRRPKHIGGGPTGTRYVAEAFGLESLWEIRPMHSRKAAHHSRKWCELCDEAFRLAFEQSGESWPS